MIIVPVKNDTIKTSAGLPSKVLSFTNYKDKGPAVISMVAGQSPAEVYFDDIAEINEQKVSLIKTSKGYNVFEVNGFVKRTFQLPQVGETISVTSDVSDSPLVVKRLKLHVQNELSSGLIVECESKNNDKVVSVLLSQITDIDSYIFSPSRFLSYYEDYSDKGRK